MAATARAGGLQSAASPRCSLAFAFLLRRRKQPFPAVAVGSLRLRAAASALSPVRFCVRTPPHSGEAMITPERHGALISLHPPCFCALLLTPTFSLPLQGTFSHFVTVLWGLLPYHEQSDDEGDASLDRWLHCLEQLFRLLYEEQTDCEWSFLFFFSQAVL
ncbi:hypothetical protein ABZP36_010932 [Zizania latifolia]